MKVEADKSAIQIFGVQADKTEHGFTSRHN